MSTAQLEVTLFGHHSFTIDGKTVTGFPSSKVMALGYYLAATGRIHTREALASLLWPDYDTAIAKKNLRGGIYHLRSRLDDYLLVTRQDVGFVDDGSVLVDSRRFEVALDQAAGAPEDDETVTAILGQAVELYRGDFLAGFHTDEAEPFDDWLRAERERHRQMAAQASSTLVQQAIREHDTLSGIKYATQLLTLDPLHEEGHRYLMLLLAQDNRQSAALAQYERCRQLLWDELGVEPDEETTALAEHIREGELSGLRFAQLPAPRRQRHNLPTELTPFVGREDELAQIQRTLVDPETRLLTITGVGGIGKSRLALQCGQCLATLLEADEEETAADDPAADIPAVALGESLPAEVLPDGVYLVRLAAIEAGEDASRRIGMAIADAFQFDMPEGVDIWAQLVQVLGERRLLLILDNFEQLQPHAELLVQLLQQMPALKLLVTSRTRLNVRGERVIALDGLTLSPEDDSAPIDLCAAGQLFLSAAATASPDFAPDETDRVAIAQACRLLRGLPLGIELAAAWTRLLSCREIAKEIQQNLDFLDSSMPDLPARHRSLRAVFEQSWRLLSENERQVMRRLSLFRGGFTRNAALAVAGASLPSLLSLLDKSLIGRVDADDDSPVRYELAEMVRQYAAERLLDSGEEDEVSAAFTRFYATFMLRLARELRSGDQVQALEQMADEQENLRNALRWAVANIGRQPEVSLPFFEASTDALFDFLDIRGGFQEGAALFGDAADALATLADEPRSRTLQASLQARRAWFLFHIGRHDESEATFRDARQVMQAADNAEEMLFILNYLAAVLHHVGRDREAEECLEAATSIRCHHPDTYVAGITENVYAQVAFATGDLEGARTHCEQALNYKRLSNDRRGRTYSLNYLGRIHIMQGELDLARRSFAESLDIAEELGDPRGIATAQLRLGDVAAASGQSVGARRQYQIALATFRQIGSLIEVSVVLTRLGRLAAEQEQVAEAVSLLLESTQIAAAIHSAPALTTALLGTSTVLLALDLSTPANEILDAVLRYPHLDPEQQAAGFRLLGDHETLEPPADDAGPTSMETLLDLAARAPILFSSATQRR